VLVEALRPQLVEQAGRVVLLSSIAAMGGSGTGPYGAMKAALHAWMFDLARQLGEHGGTANIVAPGFVPDTEFWTGRLTEQARADRAAQTLVGREGIAAEVASLIAWLLGSDGGWMQDRSFRPTAVPSWAGNRKRIVVRTADEPRRAIPHTTRSGLLTSAPHVTPTSKLKSKSFH
jgi:3-oxoacyl-[acyl-carrier protein] reductase